MWPPRPRPMCPPSMRPPSTPSLQATREPTLPRRSPGKMTSTPSPPWSSSSSMASPPPPRSNPRTRERFAAAQVPDFAAPVAEACVPTALASNARRSSLFRRAMSSR
uniref:Uncharacterized protein n=1 Tax=Arundo donax TaxID=35708 RepID=A0A0A8Y5S5_ARUDO